MIECPFSMCSKIITPVVEQAAAGDDEGTLQRVPQHQLGGHEDLGLCPASLVVLPPSADIWQMFGTQAAILKKILLDRKKAASEASGGGAGAAQPEHQLTPHPDPKHPFNRYTGTNLPTRGGGVNVPGRMPVTRTPPARPPLRALPADGSNTIGGSTLSSIGEVKEMLARAGELTAEAKDSMFVAEGKLADALQLVNFVRAESVDPIGAPQLLEAIRLLTEAAGQLQKAIEDNITYRGTR